MSQFTDLTFETADLRRRFAKKLGRHLPADFAHLLAGMARGHLDWVPDPATCTAYNAALTVLPRMRVLALLAEPNTLHLARNYVLDLPCETHTSDDGVFVTAWPDPAAHAAATREVVEAYLGTHSLVAEIAAGATTDSWHCPMLLAPVRHTYADGAPSVSTLMAVDGTARLLGARMALAADLSDWHVHKPWSDPAGLWPLTMAAARDHVAAARINARVAGVLDTGTDPGPGAPVRAVSDGSVEDWADILLPDPSRSLSDLGLYLYHLHNTPDPEAR